MNLSNLEQYALDRDTFVKMYSVVEDYIWDVFPYEGDNFKVWRYDDEWYLLHKDSGTLVNWYKHLGRTNTCNKNLTLDEHRQLTIMFMEDLLDFKVSSINKDQTEIRAYIDTDYIDGLLVDGPLEDLTENYIDMYKGRIINNILGGETCVNVVIE